MHAETVTAEEIEAMLAGDIDALAKEMAAAMNAAKAGRIIADSEEPVRDVHGKYGKFRQAPQTHMTSGRPRRMWAYLVFLAYSSAAGLGGQRVTTA